MQFSRTYLSRTLHFVAAAAGLMALSGLAARPAAAQTLVYQFSGVTFNDGATASGYFDYNPATQAFSGYDIVTTNGVTDSFVGAEYKPGANAPQTLNGASYSVFDFTANDGTFNYLALAASTFATAPSTYTLQTGSEEIALSGAGNTRMIGAGSVIVSPAVVPEASTTVSLGLLLALGGAAVAAKRKTGKRAA